jgi:hypothetical protein
VLVQIAFERECLFDGVQVLALQVLDDGQLGDQAIVGIADAGGDRRPAGMASRSQASLAADELVAAGDAADQDRLEHVVLLEALGERGDLDVAEVAAGLEGIFFDLADGELQQAAR